MGYILNNHFFLFFVAYKWIILKKEETLSPKYGLKALNIDVFSQDTSDLFITGLSNI